MRGCIWLKILLFLFVFLWVFIWICSLCLAGDPVSLKVDIDKEEVNIGEPVTIIIEVVAKKGIEVKLSPPKSLAEEMEIIQWKKVKEFMKNEGGKKSIYHMKVIPFNVGVMELPSITVSYNDRKGQTQSINSPKLKITVNSLLSKEKDMKDIRDIKPPCDVPLPWYYYFIAIIALFLIGGIIFLLWRQLKQLKKKSVKERIVTEPQRPPDEVARERLSQLRGMNLLEKGDIKQFYIVLSEILRQYLEGKHQIAAMDRTTSELYREMIQRNDIQRQYCIWVRDILLDCDLVKFAKYLPVSEKAEEHLKEVENIINQTSLSTQGVKEAGS